MDTVSNFAQLEGASANFISALQAYANNDPNATSNLLSAGEGLATATGNFMASNTQLEGMFGALGVPSSIISIGNDLIALRHATNSEQSTDAWLGLGSDGLNMVSGLAAGVGELYRSRRRSGGASALHSPVRSVLPVISFWQSWLLICRNRTA